MAYKVRLSSRADITAKKWAKSAPTKYAKLRKMVLELVHHPRTGTGHPEALRGGNGMTYSRRLTASDRLVYEIHDDVVEVLIISMEGHYADK